MEIERVDMAKMKARTETWMLDAPLLLLEGLRAPSEAPAVFEGLPADPGDIESPLDDGGKDALSDGGKDTGTPIAEQVLTGGVVTLQREGSLRALLRLILIPIESEFPSNWHKQIGLLSINPANSGQQPLSGFVNLLPSSTYVKQSDMFVRAVKHASRAGAGASRAGAGASAVTGAGDTEAADDSDDAKSSKETMATTNFVVAILVGFFVLASFVFCFVL
jgi:hypothetical protein